MGVRSWRPAPGELTGVTRHEVDVLLDIRDAVDHLHKLGRKWVTDRLSVETMLSQCDDPECSLCGIICCPEGDPLHFHHDGCPAEAELESTP